MAYRLRLSHAAEAGEWFHASRSGGFILVGAVLAFGSVMVRYIPAHFLEWQPQLAFSQPWRWWTAAWVHYSALHLLANLAGTALVVAFGIATGAPRQVAVAWLCAWPLTQLGLLAEPRLLHYAGLSGVLHAGVATVAMHAVLQPRQRFRQWVGAAVLAGLLAKVLMEAPWDQALQLRRGWDIAIAPAAHASGLLAGIVTEPICEWLAQRRMRATSAVVE